MSEALTKHLSTEKNRQPVGSVKIDSWTLGVTFDPQYYVLNLYANGKNYPILSPVAALGAMRDALEQAARDQKPVYVIYNEQNSSASIIYVGPFDL